MLNCDRLKADLDLALYETQFPLMAHIGHIGGHRWPTCWSHQSFLLYLFSNQLLLLNIISPPHHMFPIKVQRQVCYCFVITIIDPIDIIMIRTSITHCRKYYFIEFAALFDRSFIKLENLILYIQKTHSQSFLSQIWYSPKCCFVPIPRNFNNMCIQLSILICISLQVVCGISHNINNKNIW